jgi:hypothetical protein
MSDKPKKSSPADRAFQSQNRDELVKREIEAERAKSNAKTAKLRALRLAKEATDREAAAANPRPAVKAAKAQKKGG